MEIQLLSHIFRSAGFINLRVIQSKDKEILMDEAFESLSIDMVEVEDEEAEGTRLPSFLRGQVLDNWTTVELLVVFRFQKE